MKNIPAKFYTRDLFTQKALDSSEQNGRLFRLYQTIAEAGDNAPAASQTVKQPVTLRSQPKSVTPENQEPVTPPQEPVTPENQEPAPQEPVTPETPEDTQGDGDKGGDAGEKLEFNNLGEAITYIASKYGVQVETENAARKLIEEKEGVKPVIHKG